MTADAALRDDREQLHRLEIVSAVEATTLLLLLAIAVPLRYAVGWPTGTHVMGPVHGLAFLGYLWITLQTISGGGWTRADAARLILFAFVPFGGFVNVGWLRARSRALARGPT